MATMKKEPDGEHPASHYLIVEDPAVVGTWHMLYKNPDGTINRRYMGAAHAALMSPGGYRGNKYAGPNKGEAIAKLRKLYEDEKMNFSGKSLEWVAVKHPGHPNQMVHAGSRGPAVFSAAANARVADGVIARGAKLGRKVTVDKDGNIFNNGKKTKIKIKDGKVVDAKTGKPALGFEDIKSAEQDIDDIFAQYIDEDGEPETVEVEEKALPDDSYEEQMKDVYETFSRQFSPELAMPMPAPVSEAPCIEEVYSDYVIAEAKDGEAEAYYRVPYTTDENGAVTFAPRAEWEQVVEQWVATPKSVDSETVEDDEAVKVGRRNSRADAQRLQMIHDYARENGAVCGPSGKSLEDDETLVAFGGEIKAIELPDGGVKLRGPLVRFSTEDDPDLSPSRDFFTKQTDFGDAKESFAWFNHRLPVSAEFEGKRRSVTYSNPLPKAQLEIEDDAIFATIVLNARNDYEKQIAKLGMDKKLSWSSGTAPHLVDRKPTKSGANEVTRWILGLDASLTPTPAEPTNTVLPIKSLFTPDLALADAGKESEIKTASPPIVSEVKKEHDMDDTQLEALLEKVAAKSAAAAAEAVEKKLADAGPTIKAGVQVVEDEADKAARLNPFKSGGEFLMAVRNAAIFPPQTDPRLLALKATGLAENQPSQAGFLVPQQTAPGIVEKMYQVGKLLSLFNNKDPVQGNNMTYNLVDETSRANGSRQGGLTSYWLNEGGTITASKPKFRPLELKLKKVTALCVATDEQLSDAPALDSWLNRVVPEELRFRVEDAIINGDGVGKPLGIRNSGALKSATRVDASKISATDIGNMWAARWAGASDYIWLGNQSIFPQLLTMTIGQQPVFLPAGGLGGLPYATLLGRPYYDLEYAPTLGTSGDLMLVSPSQYQLIDKGGVSSASSIHVYFTTEEQAFRFSYRVDGAPIWTSTLTGFDSGTYSPYVVLAATT